MFQEIKIKIKIKILETMQFHPSPDGAVVHDSSSRGQGDWNATELSTKFILY
jgi:hypothetical protein